MSTCPLPRCPMGVATARAKERSRGKHPAHDEADAVVWEQGARAEFEALLEVLREDARAPGIEEALMARLAVVGAALMQALEARRSTDRAGARPRRGLRSRT